MPFSLFPFVLCICYHYCCCTYCRPTPNGVNNQKLNWSKFLLLFLVPCTVRIGSFLNLLECSKLTVWLHRRCFLGELALASMRPENKQKHWSWPWTLALAFITLNTKSLKTLLDFPGVLKGNFALSGGRTNCRSTYDKLSRIASQIACGFLSSQNVSLLVVILIVIKCWKGHRYSSRYATYLYQRSASALGAGLASTWHVMLTLSFSATDSRCPSDNTSPPVTSTGLSRGPSTATQTDQCFNQSINQSIRVAWVAELLEA